MINLTQENSIKLIEKLSKLIEQERYQESILLLQEFEANFNGVISFPNQMRKSLLICARAYYLCNEYDKAKKYLEEFEKIQKDIDTFDIEYIKLKCWLLKATGSISAALDFLSNAIRNELLKEDELFELIYYLGEFQFWNGNYLEANKCFHKCYRYYALSGNRYMFGIVASGLGYLAFQRSLYDIADSYYEKALICFENLGDNYQIGKVYKLRGLLAYRIGRYSEAKRLLSSAKKQFDKCHRNVALIDTEISFARAAMSMGEYIEAERYLLSGLAASEKISYKRGAALSAEFLGEIYLIQSEYNRSREYLKIAEKLALEIAPAGDIAVEVYRRLGDLHIATNNINEAEKYLSKAKELAEHLSDRFELGTIYRAYGLLHAQKGDMDCARSYFAEALSILDVIKARLELAQTYLAAAEVYRRWSSICPSANFGDELIQDAERYEVEALHLYQSLGLEKKSRELEARRIKRKQSSITDSDFVTLKIENSWIYDGNIVARSNVMLEALRKAERLAGEEVPIFIIGETGTGKEIIARLIHRLSDRSSSHFVTVNCAAIPETVFESELFGHRRGSFTGAIEDKPGLIEMASGGTLFFDEISQLTDRQQAKLLRVIETSRVRRVGETKERNVDIRVISASRSTDSVSIRTTWRSSLLRLILCSTSSAKMTRKRSRSMFGRRHSSGSRVKGIARRLYLRWFASVSYARRLLLST